MRCKKHPSDLSGTVGVCASCLRERLFNLIAAQTQADLAQAQAQYHHPPPLFPRSVSPYISNRKSDHQNQNNNHHHHHHITFPFPRFFSTPQFGATTNTNESNSNKKKKGGKFSLIANLFKFNKSSKSDFRVSRDPCNSSTSTSTSATRMFGNGNHHRRTCRMMDRGMSPVRASQDGDFYNGPISPQMGSRLPSHRRMFGRHVS